MSEPMLELNKVTARYGVLPVLHSVSLEIFPREIVAQICLCRQILSRGEHPVHVGERAVDPAGDLVRDPRIGVRDLDLAGASSVQLLKRMVARGCAFNLWDV